MVSMRKTCTGGRWHVAFAVLSVVWLATDVAGLASTPPYPDGLPYRRNEVIVELMPGIDEQAALGEINERYGSSVAKKGYMPGVYKLQLSRSVDDVYSKMLSERNIFGVYRNHLRFVSDVPDDPLYTLFRYPPPAYQGVSYGQWALQYDSYYNKYHIRAPEAWDIEKGKRDVVVAVIDTGVRVDELRSEDGTELLRRPHPDLGDWKRCPTEPAVTAPVNYVPEPLPAGVLRHAGRLLDGVDFTDDEDPEDESPSENDSDEYIVETAGHGTHVAGIIAAKTNNGQGIASLCWNNVWILPLKIFGDDSGGADLFDLVNAISYCTTYRNTQDVDGSVLKVDVINMSLGGFYPTSLEENAIKQAARAGIVLVAAAGNYWEYGPYPPLYPAAYDDVICVGATEIRDIITPFSQRGNAMDIAAPGADVLSAVWRRDMVDEDAIESFNTGQGGIDQCDLGLPPTAPAPDQPAEVQIGIWGGYDIWGNGYVRWDGTSMSTPMVAAAAALLRSLDVPTGDVKQILCETAKPVGAGRPNDTYGWGLLNVYAALKQAVIDVKIESPSNGGIVTSYRPTFQVAFRHAKKDTIRIEIDGRLVIGPAEESPELGYLGDAGDSNPGNLTQEYYYILDEEAGKTYVRFPYQLDSAPIPGDVHTIHVSAESDVVLDLPPPVPFEDEETAQFRVRPMTLARGWHLFSVPLSIDPPSAPETVFGSESGILARWHYASSSAGRYALYSLDGSRAEAEASLAPPSVTERKLACPLDSSEATPPAGVGYWLYVTDPDGLALPDAAGSAVDSAPYAVSIYRGWNMVGNPFQFPVDWASVIVEYGGLRASAVQAVANGWLAGSVFRYDNAYRRYTWQKIESGVMIPWEAQWVNARVAGPDGWPEPDLKLIIPPNRYTGPVQ